MILELLVSFPSCLHDSLNARFHIAFRSQVAPEVNLGIHRWVLYGESSYLVPFINSPAVSPHLLERVLRVCMGV